MHLAPRPLSHASSDDNRDGGAHGGGYEYDAQPDMRSQRRQGGGGSDRQYDNMRGGGGGDRRDDRRGGGGGDRRDDRRGGGGRGGGREDFDRMMAEKRYGNAVGRDLLSKAENPYQVGKSADPVEQIVKRCVRGGVTRSWRPCGQHGRPIPLLFSLPASPAASRAS